MAVMRNSDQFNRLLKHAPSDATRTLLAAAGDGLSDAGVIWLEFDVSDDGFAGDPSFFVASNLRPTPHLNAAALTRGLSLALSGREIDVSSFLAKLPEGVYLRQSGMMAGRPGRSEAVRLVLDGVKVKEVPACWS